MKQVIIVLFCASWLCVLCVSVCSAFHSRLKQRLQRRRGRRDRHAVNFEKDREFETQDIISLLECLLLTLPALWATLLERNLVTHEYFLHGKRCVCSPNGRLNLYRCLI